MKELEDQSWFPTIFRRYQADYIGSLVKWLSVYLPLVPELQQLIDENHPQFIQDLCSGSGITATFIQDQLKNSPPTILSDKYPDGCFKDGPKSRYIKTSTDALALTTQPHVCYTMYNAFHHFSSRQKKELIRKMAVNKNPFFFAEILRPGILTLIRIIFAATILQLITAPFIKPFSLTRLFFTYILPVNLITVLFDGIVSVFKSGSADHYRKLVQDISDRGFKISVGQHNDWKRSVIFIKGNPVRS